jgi:hypothetical protein
LEKERKYQKMVNQILLGFEVGTAEPVYMRLHHLAIFGLTQLSGKTTTLEALISRSGLKAIAFIVKRGESGFTKYNLVTPYYKPKANWQFVEGLVNVALGEKVKFEPGMRWAIIKVSKGAKDLREVKARAEEMLEKAKRDFQKQLFEKLITYLEIVVPELERWQFSDKLELTEGVNVMDLSEMRTETQHLVIASTIEYVFQNLDHVVVIIPEAWECLPQNKMTPVKWVAQQFIRKGAAIGNYLFIDSQDIGGIDKTPLRQCDNWLMGRMKEAHEVERILKQLLGMKVPAEEIQTLPLGHFYAAIGNEVKKVYVLPVGVPEDVGREVALGKRSPESVRDEFLKPKLVEVNDLIWKEKYEQLEREGIKEYEVKMGTLRQKVEELETQVKKNLEEIGKLKDEKATLEAALKKLEPLKAFGEALRKFLAECSNVRVAGFEPPASMPSEISVAIQQPTLTIQKRTPPLSLDDSTLEGKIAIVYAEGELPKDKWFSVSDVTKAFQRHGWKQDPRTSSALDKFCQWGYFVKQMSGKRPDYRIKLDVEEAKKRGLLRILEVNK